MLDLFKTRRRSKINLRLKENFLDYVFGQDKMMFCDRCDRGYHTFCVGLNDLPSGRWICPKFCRKTTGGSDTPARNSDQGSRSSTPLELNKCTECGEIVSKEQLKSARRNRQRKRNLCENCSLLKKK